MKIKNEIWILADDRPGTFSQSIGLAEELGVEYKIITISYNFFSWLPNFILSNSPLRIPKKIRQKIATIGYLPKIIISAGRRCAPIALHLKEQSQNQSKIIQIMKPDLDLGRFDFVVLPTHDNVDEKQFPNLINTIGSLTRVDQQRLLTESTKFPEFDQITKKKIALLIGGNGKKTIFSAADITQLAQTSSKIAKNMDATLLILTSRRTGHELSETLQKNLEGDFKIFDWEKLNGSNPYIAILSHADFFIVTGDSVSMISECASTGKPVYIFDQNKISSDKHRKFHQDLIKESYVRKLNDDLKILENFSDKKLQETKRVAAIIKSKIKLD